MSRTRFFSLPIKLLPAALAAALVMAGSATVASAQYYDQNAPADQNAPPDQGSYDQNNVQADPSSRVARLAYLSGDVEFAPAGESTFGSADINRPLTTGDRLLTGSDGRAALELGDAALRINDNSAFNFLDLNDTTTQVELSQGTLNLRVRTIGSGQTYEIDTPSVAFVASQPGTYRVDVAPDGNGAMVTVFEGAGTVYGENGVSRPVDAGQSYRFNDTSLTNVEVQGLPAPDDFDRFAEARDTRYTNSISRRYVSPDVVGYDDLDQYGDWQSTPDNGEVWYPNQVAAGWTPYRDGHWAWIDPWGWTWVDNEPWGYAPFHYGRWAYVGNRWGWVPGPIAEAPVYAPALVAFVGGSGFGLSISVGGGGYGGGYDNQPVGWFPLGPRDVYVPPYRASRGYFNSVNVTNIRNVYVNKTVINNYYGNYAAGRPFAGTRQYAYRDNPHALTAVPRNVFANARPVKAAVVRIDPAKLAKATVVAMPHVAPNQTSLGIRTPQRPIATPGVKAFDRTVVARHAPPPPPVPFDAREKLIAKRGGAPLPVTELRQMRQQRAKALPNPQRVKVVAAAPKTGAPLPPMKQVSGKPGMPAKSPVVQAPQRGQKPPYMANSIHPIQVPLNPAKGAAPNPSKQAATRPGELPSARFAHPQRDAGPNAPANTPQERAAQAQQRAQSHAAQAQQDQQRAEQAKQQADQARTQQEQQRAQAAQQGAQQRDAQARAQQDQQRAAQAKQQADQARAQQEQQRTQAAQQASQQHEAQARAQQEQQRAAQAKQQADQARAQQEQQRAQAAQQASQQREAQARAQQEQQRAEQARAQQEQQQRQAQMQQQRQAQMQQQRQAQVQQQQAQQAQMRAQQQRNAPPPQRPQDQKKRKDEQNQQDNGGH